MGEEKHDENESFRLWLKQQTQYSDETIDPKVHAIYERVNEGVSCTDCGKCCTHLIVNITPKEISATADFLQMPEAQFREEYIEESMAGNCFINAVPCHFLSEKKCSIYEHRFTECRDFPHLHKPGFRARLLGTLLHYGTCPIIYNTVEELKTELEFR